MASFQYYSKRTKKTHVDRLSLFSRPSPEQKTLKMTASDVHKCCWCEWTREADIHRLFSISINMLQSWTGPLFPSTIRACLHQRKTGFLIIPWDLDFIQDEQLLSTKYIELTRLNFNFTLNHFPLQINLI